MVLGKAALFGPLQRTTPAAQHSRRRRLVRPTEPTKASHRSAGLGQGLVRVYRWQKPQIGSHILLLRCVHCSGRRRKGLINFGQPLLYVEGFGMSTLDEITKEKQRLGEALARVDAQREKLSRDQK